ncbi:wall-associated receptor kinase-like 2 isoform X1 [Citrus sinensis]|uniref:wall-associated receptor kinase-like 2 isoform X1 n=1 Tax=Citrus sinensis TaxID=2711 RepID=UPI002277AA11|nr:wall-associated receptor kinase-like 2 isoform X1 [Citrus sinensis]
MWMLWLMMLLLTWPATGTKAETGSLINVKPGCEEKCGDVTVPYPFGIGNRKCAMNGDFFLFCDRSASPPQPKFEDVVVLNISITDGSIIARIPTAQRCYNGFGNVLNSTDIKVDLVLRPFRLSGTRNKLTAFGCDTIAFMTDAMGDFGSGCASLCTINESFKKLNNIIENSCSGIGCCQTPLRKILNKTLTITLDSRSNYSKTLTEEFITCDYAVLADESFDLSGLHFSDKSSSNVTVEWIIKDEESCGDNTNLTYSENGQGYRCVCQPGYKGNPYLGCRVFTVRTCVTDIDECNEGYPCEGTCKNTPGSYTCQCPIGMHGDGKLGCRGFRITTIVAGCVVVLGVLFLLLIGLWWLYKFIKRRRKIKRKQKFFKRNGGLLLRQELSSNEGNIEKTKLFTSKDLEKATDNYNVSRILGQGGQGTVFKGMLTDGRIVAVKKSKSVHESNVEQFINEVIILSQINHRNVVKLLGCCLETEVPLLVYEFIPNGSLHQYIHEQTEDQLPITWEIRLGIAVEVSGALSYLHSAASIPIYHRDIKSANILLDDKYRAKISDFGTSRSMAVDRTHLTTQVKGTFGYLDPEYFQSSQFTEKSDVYSFGVVLVELLTGQKPIRLVETEENRSLAAYFLQVINENRLFEVLDAQVLREAEKEEVITVAMVAKRCLNLNGKKRPTMKEVALELAGIRASIGASVLRQCEEIDFVNYDNARHFKTGSSSTGSFFNSVTFSVDGDPLLSNKW